MTSYDRDKDIERLQDLVMKPIVFNDAAIMLVDALEAHHESGWNVPEHRHPWFEFSFVFEGSFCTAIDGKEFETGPGCFSLVPPGVLHSNRHLSALPDNGICLRWQIEKNKGADLAKGQQGSCQAIIRALSTVRAFSAEAADIGRAIDNLLCRTDTASMQIAFLELVFLLVERWHEAVPALVKERPRNEILVQQALLYLTEYYASRITIQELARSLNISARHLVRIFHEYTGETVIRRLNEIRIGHARQLLKTTGKTTREIALMVGLENEFYFSNVFSKYSHMTPSQYRKSQ